MHLRNLGTRAFTLVELAIVVLVLGVVISGIVQVTNRYGVQRVDNQAAQEVSQITSAVEAFVRNSAAEITKGDGTASASCNTTNVCGFLWSPSATGQNAAAIKWINFASSADTINTSSGAQRVVDAIKTYLPSGFSPANSYYIGFKRTGDIIVNGTSGPPNISALVVRVPAAGDNISDTRLARIAATIGNKGGFISTTAAQNNPAVTGAFGGWQANLTGYGLPNSNPPDTRGAITALTSFSATSNLLANNLLSRVPTGNPEANTMRTGLDMGNTIATDPSKVNTINNAAIINGVDQGGVDPKKGNIQINGILSGRKQPLLDQGNANLLQLNNNTVLSASTGIALGGISTGGQLSFPGNPQHQIAGTTAVAGQNCVYNLVNVPADQNIDIKSTNSGDTGYKIRHKIGVYGGDIDWKVADNVILNQLPAATDYQRVMVPYFRAADLTVTQESDYNNPTVINSVIPMTVNYQDVGNGKIDAKIGYSGRILVGRSSNFLDEPAVLICDGRYWKNLNQTGMIGPANPAWAAASVSGVGGSVKTTYAPFEKDQGAGEPFLQPGERSRQLYATLGLNVICGYQTNPTNASAAMQLKCGTPKAILGKQACFWSNGTGGFYLDDKIYPLKKSDINTDGMTASLNYFLPGMGGGSTNDSQTSYSMNNEPIYNYMSQQICPGGYYVAGMAINGADSAPTLDLGPLMTSGGRNYHCGDDDSDCGYIYCCPFAPDPDLNLYDDDQIYYQGEGNTEAYKPWIIN